MDDARLKLWEVLFARAWVLIDSARELGIPVEDWSFGGGTVLMRRHRHRLSKDIDIFIGDPQFLGYLTPRLNAVAESLTPHYVEDHNYVKLAFDEGEIDFVASSPLTLSPTRAEMILGRAFLVESSTEIVAKKIWHRGALITARDIFDLAMVAELEPEALREIAPILRDRREAVFKRIAKYEEILRQDFGMLVRLNYQRDFDHCLRIAREVFESAG